MIEMSTSSPRRKTIVITGCSSGFGRQTALYLANQGWQVFATVRKEVDQANLQEEAVKQDGQGQLTVLICDITRPDEIAALAQAVAAATFHLDALLNNAGTAFASPLELISLDDFRAQLEINVVAHLGVIQAFLPLLKTARGTIINISSISGRIATPIMGAYAASKFALEALSDTLRVELAPFGVKVVIIEPGSSPTSIWETGRQRAARKLEEQREGTYRQLLNIFEKLALNSARKGFPPQLVADAVLRILTSRHPRARYAVPLSARLGISLRQILPDRLWDRQLRRVLKW
jgi:NAD(P)-dependent dehydrogenase (short-subunit alcohol dehydrogenase family)